VPPSVQPGASWLTGVVHKDDFDTAYNAAGQRRAMIPPGWSGVLPPLLGDLPREWRRPGGRLVLGSSLRLLEAVFQQPQEDVYIVHRNPPTAQPVLGLAWYTLGVLVYRPRV